MMSQEKVNKLVKQAQKNKIGRINNYATNKDEAKRIAAAYALGFADSDDAFNALISLVRDPSVEVRITAVNSLARMGKPLAKEHVRHAYQDMQDERLTQACTSALATLNNLEKHAA